MVPTTSRYKESKVEAHLIRCVKAHGGKIKKVRWVGRRGAPDRLVILPGISAFVELKRPREILRKNQELEHVDLRFGGLRIETAYNLEQVEELVCRLVALTNRTVTR